MTMDSDDPETTDTRYTRDAQLRKALKILRDGRISLDNFVLDILNTQKIEFSSYQDRFFANPSGTLGKPLNCMLEIPGHLFLVATPTKCAKENKSCITGSITVRSGGLLSPWSITSANSQPIINSADMPANKGPILRWRPWAICVSHSNQTGNVIPVQQNVFMLDTQLLPHAHVDLGCKICRLDQYVVTSFPIRGGRTATKIWPSTLDRDTGKHRGAERDREDHRMVVAWGHKDTPLIPSCLQGQASTGEQNGIARTAVWQAPGSRTGSQGPPYGGGMGSRGHTIDPELPARTGKHQGAERDRKDRRIAVVQGHQDTLLVPSYLQAQASIGGKPVWELTFPSVWTSEQLEHRKCGQTMFGRRLNYGEAAKRQTVTMSHPACSARAALAHPTASRAHVLPLPPSPNPLRRLAHLPTPACPHHDAQGPAMSAPQCLIQHDYVGIRGNPTFYDLNSCSVPFGHFTTIRTRVYVRACRSAQRRMTLSGLRGPLSSWQWAVSLGNGVRSSGLMNTMDDVIHRMLEGRTLYSVVIVLSVIVLITWTFISHTISSVLLVPIAQQDLLGNHANLLILLTGLICSTGMGRRKRMISDKFRTGLSHKRRLPQEWYSSELHRSIEFDANPDRTASYNIIELVHYQTIAPRVPVSLEWFGQLSLNSFQVVFVSTKRSFPTVPVSPNFSRPAPLTLIPSWDYTSMLRVRFDYALVPVGACTYPIISGPFDNLSASQVALDGSPSILVTPGSPGLRTVSAWIGLSSQLMTDLLLELRALQPQLHWVVEVIHSHPCLASWGLAWQTISSSGEDCLSVPSSNALTEIGPRYGNTWNPTQLEPGGVLTRGTATDWTIALTVQGKIAIMDTGMTGMACPTNVIAAIYAQVPNSSPGTATNSSYPRPYDPPSVGFAALSEVTIAQNGANGTVPSTTIGGVAAVVIVLHLASSSGWDGV
ncbi:hypothetical protein HD554DRAFT_2041943 [Boletus coccyginus]|nr:hypothetical protein HD554DRAFT_2041943 [Boletus coccyginus]